VKYNNSAMVKVRNRLLVLIIFLFTGITGLFAADGQAIDSGATAWMLTSTALVLLMIPGLAMFYGGLVRSKNVLGTIMHSFVAMGIISVLWVVAGYSMSFGKSILGGWFGWNNDYFFLKGIDENIMEAGIPEYVFSMFQGKFAIITPALIAGAFAERVSFRAYCIFIAVWSLLVYNPLCHWVWASDGFLFNLGAKGAIDYAGGTVVHISAGVSGLMAALYLGSRRGYPYQVIRPNNLVITMLGAGLLWVGWFGFNAGSALSAGALASSAFVATHLSAAAATLAWAGAEWLRNGKPSVLGAISGSVAGLVAVTPAAGFVSPVSALLIGFAAGLFCYFMVAKIKGSFGYDDSLDAFGVHGAGGTLGALLTGVLATSGVNAVFKNSSGSALPVGLVDGNFRQLLNQAGAVLLTWAIAAAGTYVILKIVDVIIGVRVSPEEEIMGLDLSQHGEEGYNM
jgi:Amt family ammonium transporter